MSSYRDFVKATYHKLPESLLSKDKMREIGRLWQEHKSTLPPSEKVAKVRVAKVKAPVKKDDDYHNLRVAAAKRLIELAQKKKHTANEKAEYNRLHGLHASGFFDDLWSGIKSVGSTALSMAPKLLPLLL